MAQGKLISIYYILRDKRPIKCTLLKWAQWLETADRHVANDERGSVRVSTVFLGIDHSFGHGRPQLFETMVFGGELDGEMRRYATWEQAETGHAMMCAKVWDEKRTLSAHSKPPTSRK